jgi:hypothetical protein
VSGRYREADRRDRQIYKNYIIFIWRERGREGGREGGREEGLYR